LALLNIKNLTIGFGGAPLLDNISLQIEKGEKVSLVGRNGTGKSTLMKIINGEYSADSGELFYQQGIKVSRLEQEVPDGLDGTVYEVVASGDEKSAALLVKYHELNEKLLDNPDDSVLTELESVQHKLEVGGYWELHQKVDIAISKLKLNPNEPFSNLSGGLKRRALLAKALVEEPDILLLDEPTNHLDIDSILWLEDFLGKYKGTILFVTHDRMFLRKLATRIVEIDRGKLYSWDCNYETYLKRKEDFLESQKMQNHNFDKKLAQEEKWIRQGVKARRTRNEGRVKSLEKMREEWTERRKLIGNVNFTTQNVEYSGKIAIKTKNVNFAYDENRVISDFTTTVIRGDKIGIIGPNGSGKTTILKILLGELEPQKGSVKLGTNLEISYFDQLRAQLEDDKTVQDNIANGNNVVTFNGKSKHVISYLKDFLFSPDRAKSPVSILSGGERNRLLLAKLFTTSSNILVLDEPTNDLDTETLELLEELLSEYKGTLLLVSHDRAFLNNVVTSTLVIEKNGYVQQYAGGYDDWLLQKKPDAVVTKVKKTVAKAKRAKPRKLTYKEKRELEKLPGLIEELETEQAHILKLIGEPSFYQGDKDEIIKTNKRVPELETLLSSAYDRWGELDMLL
jgi:ABC transport system ATP-binding/permease protein